MTAWSNKCGHTALCASARSLLQIHLTAIRALHENDLCEGFGWLYGSHVLAVPYPKADCDIQTVQEVLSHENVETRMVDTPVWNKSGHGVNRPPDT